jgi:Domain of unknown function (DUF4136)
MVKLPWRVRASVAVAGIAVAVQAVMAVDVRFDFEKTFDFKAVRTWAWNAEGPGEVKMVRSAADDPDAMRKRAEPVIMNAVKDEMDRRGWRLTTDAPDLSITYFLLLSTNVTTQTVGQFLPATAMWGLPPYAPATQSLKMMNQGSLLLDLNANKQVVWRGVAEAKIKMDEDAKRREARLREAVRDLLRKVPK